jgi:ribonuclease P protein component
MRRRSEFTAVVHDGRRRSGRVLTLHAAPAPAADHTTHVGFVIGRPVGSAVTRNAVRRRLRGVARDLLPGLPLGTRLVVRARPGAAAASYTELHAEFERLVAQLTASPGGQP